MPTRDELYERARSLGAAPPEAATKDQLNALLAMIDPRSTRRVTVAEGRRVTFGGKHYVAGDEIELPGDHALQHVLAGVAVPNAGELPVPQPSGVSVSPDAATATHAGGE